MLFSCSISHVWLFCNPKDCSLLGSFVHGISQSRILMSVAIFFPRGSSQSRDRTWVSCIGRQILYHWVPREALADVYYMLTKYSLYQKKLMNKGSLIMESLLLEIKYFLSPKIISFVRNVIFLIKFLSEKVTLSYQ